MKEILEKYLIGLNGYTFRSDDKKYILNCFDEVDKEIERLNNTIDNLIKERDCLFNNTKIEYENKIQKLNNIIKRIKDHFVFLKINSDGGNKEFFEDIIEMIEAMEKLKEGVNNE